MDDTTRSAPAKNRLVIQDYSFNYNRRKYTSTYNCLVKVSKDIEIYQYNIFNVCVLLISVNTGTKICTKYRKKSGEKGPTTGTDGNKLQK